MICVRLKIRPIGLFTVFISVIWAIYQHSTEEENQEPLPNKENTKIILFWNSLYDEDKYFAMGKGYEGFQNCAHSNCFTTTQRSKLMDEQTVVHAVVFHAPQLKDQDAQWLKKHRPDIRKHNQGIDPLFVFFSLEPPEGSFRNAQVLKDSILQDFFNLTVSYRMASDIYRPYGAFIDKTTGKPAIQWQNPSNGKNSPYSHKNHTKAKDIAWIVSHCETVNLREKYASQLKALHRLKVDIYGSCGDHFLPKSPMLDDVIERREWAYAKLAEDYKFYLSFENSGCQDYVTEKFWNALKYGMLPIAMGGLEAQEYEQIAPPHSFLHVDNFESPQELMEYLVKLSQDEDLFNAYFWWKDHYSIEQWPNDFVRASCQLCQILNTQDYQSPNNYGNMHDFWHTCRPPLHQPTLPLLRFGLDLAYHSVRQLFQ